MSALHNFIQAAASFYGVPLGQLTEGCAVDSSTGEFEVVLRFVVSPDDLAGIGKRMEAMLHEAQVDAATAVDTYARVMVGGDELRVVYNALSAAERSAFGSFAKFKAQWAPAEEALQKVELPAHVWVPGVELTEQQKAMAMSMDAGGRYAVDPADLTEEQKAEYVPGYEGKRAGPESQHIESIRRGPPR